VLNKRGEQGVVFAWHTTAVCLKNPYKQLFFFKISCFECISKITRAFSEDNSGWPKYQGKAKNHLSPLLKSTIFLSALVLT
jgi:hypothetical protein